MSTLARRLAASPVVIAAAVPRAWRFGHLLALGAAVVALAVAFLAIRPTAAPPLAYDTYASVLHFERLVGGRQLESLVGTTPKPLLTLVLGFAYAAGGWTLVSVASIAAWAAAVGLGTALVTRLAGFGGGAAVAAFLIASPALLLETGWGLASTWALGLWFAAALAVVPPRPRWGLAGVLLGLAALARLETFLLVGTALALIAARRVLAGRSRRTERPATVTPPAVVPTASPGMDPGGDHRNRSWRAAFPPGPWRLVVALGALPVMLVHDALLTGDPFFWARISALYGQALAGVGALPDAWSAAREVAEFPVSLPVASLLALVGAAALFRRRSWVVLGGLVALGPGMCVFFVTLAASGRFADPRYLVPVESSILVAAAIGIGEIATVGGRWLDGLARRRARQRGDSRAAGLRGRAAVAVGGLTIAGAVAALLASPVIGPIDPSTTATLDRFRALANSAAVAEPVLLEELFPYADPSKGAAGRSAAPVRENVAVPGNVRLRMAIDLDLPLTHVIATDPSAIDPARGSPPAGQIVVHSGGDLPAAAFAIFEITGPRPEGPVVLIPLLHDAANATWVVKIEGSGGFSSGGGAIHR